MAALDLWVVCQSDVFAETVQELATRLQLPFMLDIDIEGAALPAFVLLVDEQGISLQQTGRKAPGPIRVEFTEGAVDHRRKFGGGKGQMIAKAVGIKAGVYPRVLDATAGLGKDAFVLATLGCQVQMLERSPYVHTLLQNGLTRARQFSAAEDPELASIVARMELLSIDSHDYLSQLSNKRLTSIDVVDSDRPDVIYLDPMFPERQKSADVKKEMAAFHHLVGKDEDADLLLEKALANAHYRVVVKRPRKAPLLGENSGRKPSHQLEGKSSRYDIYTLKKMPDRLNSFIE